MRCTYSVVRFVPDPARGEFINVGVVVGSEDSSEWQVRQIDNPVRARYVDEGGVLTAAWEFIDELGREIDDYEQSFDQLLEPEVTVSEDWLWELHRRHRNIVQLSEPTPMAAESVESAVERIFDMMLVDPVRSRSTFKRKLVASAAVRRAYRGLGLVPDENLFERPTLIAEPHTERLDFAVANGEAVQLTQTWSFQVPDQETLAEQIKAWGWTVERLRDAGEASLRLPTGGTRFVGGEIDVEVVYVPPSVDGESPAMEGAWDVFDAVGAVPVPMSSAEDVAMRATRLLAL